MKKKLEDFLILNKFKVYKVEKKNKMEINLK